MLNMIKKFLLCWFSPYTVFYIDSFGEMVEVHYSWTFEDALEWTACSLRDEDVGIYRYSELVAVRDAVTEC